jgi:hypothetical protein
MLGRLQMSVSQCQDAYGEFAKKVFGDPKHTINEGAFKGTNLKNAILKIVQDQNKGSKMMEVQHNSCKVYALLSTRAGGIVD